MRPKIDIIASHNEIMDLIDEFKTEDDYEKEYNKDKHINDTTIDKYMNEISKLVDIKIPKNKNKDAKKYWCMH